jgi:hypothetical protein
MERLRTVGQDGMSTEVEETMLEGAAEIERLRAALDPVRLLSVITTWNNTRQIMHYSDILKLAGLISKSDDVQQTTDKCQKCGTALDGEVALVGGQLWCHSCADGR